MPAVPSETFPELELPRVRHAFLCRVPGVDTGVERYEALRRLDQYHAQARRELGFGGMPFITAEQVHGNGIAAVDGQTAAPAPGVDGLITNDLRVALGIYVADCCALYLVDPVAKAIGLVHSGKKGTTLGIARVAIEKMREHFGCDPANMIAQLSPCIRPPSYEVDFAADIVTQCRESGISRVCDCGTDTAADLSSYYSYRAEHGKTGRMLALLALD